jgi:hypothetical protein
LGISSSQRPQLAFSTAGNLYLLSVYEDGGKQRLALVTSPDGGDTFSGPVTISDGEAAVSARGENGPSLAQQGMAVYALWQQPSDSGLQVLFARSLDMGGRFSPPVRLTVKQDSSFSGFSSMVVAPGGNIYVVWLDGRQPVLPGTLNIYLAKSTDKGATFSRGIRVVTGVCPCCRPVVAAGSSGDVYVAWRGVFQNQERDIALAVSHDGAQSFSEPVRVAQDHWVLQACPEAGPALAVAGGKLLVAWHTQASHRRAEIRLATSQDHGRSFSPAVPVSGEALDANHPALSVSDDRTVLLAFQGRDEKALQGWGTTRPYLVVIERDGTPKPPVPVPVGPGSAAYPALVATSSGRGFLAWTQRGSGGKAEVHLARARIQGN